MPRTKNPDLQKKPNKTPNENLPLQSSNNHTSSKPRKTKKTLAFSPPPPSSPPNLIFNPLTEITP